MRQIVLDTETTGLDPAQHHRIIEIGCVELVDRRLTGNNFHQYLQPDREIDAGAVEVHGITNEFLADKPRFADILNDFVDYIDGAELIIHNAPFDVGFINHEFRLVGHAAILADICTVTDTLAMARKMHPGQRNSLDALCKRYDVDSSQRTLHGALLDAEILADVFLAMTGGQATLSLDGHFAGDAKTQEDRGVRRVDVNRGRLSVVVATESELDRHATCLQTINKASGGQCLWLAEKD